MVKEIDAEDLKEKMDKGEDFVLVDCREQDEWDAGHIEEAIFIPLSQVEDLYTKLDEMNAKDKEIVCQCRSGKRSLKFAEFLETKGYTNLTNLEGGILGWQEEGYPIVT